MRILSRSSILHFIMK